jgi:hypothetical protein
MHERWRISRALAVFAVAACAAVHDQSNPRADGRSGGGGAGKWIRRLASASLTRIQVITHANKNGEILRRGRMLNLEIVEVNRVIEEHNPTADLALELLLSVFGKKIL